MRAFTFRILVGLLLAGVSTFGCTNDESQAMVGNQINSGVDSTDDQNAVVRLFSQDFGVCSGTLIAPNLVLTAAHCFIDSETDYTSCDVGDRFGTGPLEANPVRIVSASKIRVQVGVHVPDDEQVDALGQEIRLFEMPRNSDDASKAKPILCGHDVALLFLDRALSMAPVFAVAASNDSSDQRDYLAVGWGRLSNNQRTRVRQQLAVRSIDPIDVSPSFANAATDLVVVPSPTRPGDSGGPLLRVRRNELGAIAEYQIVGVVSGGIPEREFLRNAPPRGQPNDPLVASRYTRLDAFMTRVEEAIGEANALLRGE